MVVGQAANVSPDVPETAMQHKFQPEENRTPQSTYLAAQQTFLTAETEAETQAVQDITHQLNDITKSVNLFFAREVKILLATMICFGLGIAFLSIIMQALDGAREKALVLFGCLIVVGLCLKMWSVIRATPRFDAGEIARLGGLKAIAPLCASLAVPIPGKQRRAIHNALIKLLPQLKASDANLTTPTALGYIYSCLRLNGDGTFGKKCPTDLRIAALKALEQVGDARAIPLVERLTKMRFGTQNRLRVKQAAIECLPMLRANCGEVEAARTLLRASHAEDARPETLLRPASGAEPTALQELLRGAEPPK